MTCVSQKGGNWAKNVLFVKCQWAKKCVHLCRGYFLRGKVVKESVRLCILYVKSSAVLDDLSGTESCVWIKTRALSLE